MTINWNPVAMGSTAGAAQGIQGATNSLNDAFGIFSKLLQQREAFDAAQVLKADEVNKQAYLDALQGKGSVEELQAFEASGAAAAMREKLRAETRGQVRNGLDARSQFLVNSQRDAQVFGWRGQEATRAEQAGTRAQAADTRAAAEAGRAAELFPLQLAASRATTNLTTQQVAASQAAAAASAQSVRESQNRIETSVMEEVRKGTKAAEDALAARTTAYTSTLDKLTKEDENTVGTAKGTERLIGSISKVITDPAALRDATAFISKAMASNPKFAALPTDVVERLVLSRADDYATYFGGTDSGLTSYLTQGLNQALVDQAPKMLENATKRTSLTELAQRQKLALETLGPNQPQPSNPNGAAAIDAASKAAPLVSEATAPAAVPPLTPAQVQQAVVASSKGATAVSDEDILKAVKTSGVMGWKKQFLKEAFPKGEPEYRRGSTVSTDEREKYARFESDLDRRLKALLSNR